MAEENVQVTQPTQPVAEEATKPESMKLIYMSKDDNPFVPMLVPESFSIVGDYQYPFVTVAPDASIKSPKYNWATHEWFENEGSEIGEQFTKLANELKQFNTRLEAQQKQTQEVVANNTAVQKELKGYGQMIVSMNANSGKTNAMLAQLVNAINKMQAKPAETTTDAKEEGAE